MIQATLAHGGRLDTPGGNVAAEPCRADGGIATAGGGVTRRMEFPLGEDACEGRTAAGWPAGGGSLVTMRNSRPMGGGGSPGRRLRHVKIPVVDHLVGGDAGYARQHGDGGEVVAAGRPIGVDLNRRVVAASGQMHEIVQVRVGIETREHLVDIERVATAAGLEIL